MYCFNFSRNQLTEKWQKNSGLGGGVTDLVTFAGGVSTPLHAMARTILVGPKFIFIKIGF